MRSLIGTSAFGLRLPIVKQGDDLVGCILNSLSEATLNHEYIPNENDIIGITESLVARVNGKYVTVDDVVKSLEQIFTDNSYVFVYNPIFSRNRFSVILRAIARYFKKVTIVCDVIDEVGNVIEHPITKVNYKQFYRQIVESEGSKFEWVEDDSSIYLLKDGENIINCTLHPELWHGWTGGTYLKDICNDVSEWGLLGSNKVGEELLKLFPDRKDTLFVETLQSEVKKAFGLKNVEVMIYGDGCYKDASSGIWEFADPVVSPAYTEGLEGTPNELKLKYLADDEFKNLNGMELQDAICERIANKNVVQGNMETQGTTPRKFTDLLGSLMDLISGSGDKGTPVVIVQNYSRNYSMD